MKARSAFFVFTVAVAALACFVGGASPASESTSSKRLRPMHIEQAGTYYVVEEISEKAGIPIGIDAIVQPSEPTVILDFPGGTTADLLNMFIAKSPKYSWRENADGVIRVTRTNAAVSVVDVVIAYPGAENKTRQEIWQDIVTRPEISAWRDSVNCIGGEVFGGGEFQHHNGPISIAAGDHTLESLLDEIAIKSGENLWGVLEWPADKYGPCRVAIIAW